jgi:hypothetical protein
MSINIMNRNTPLLKARRIKSGNFGDKRGPYIARINDATHIVAGFSKNRVSCSI